MRFESEPRLYSIQHCRYAKVKLKCRIFLTSQENLIPKLGVYIHCVYDFFFFFSQENDLFPVVHKTCKALAVWKGGG